MFVGYADSLHATGFFPTPWSGSSGVTFEGCAPPSACTYDGGAIELFNSSSAPVTINSVSVQLNAPGDTVACVVNLWPSNLALASGSALIDTQTASGAGSGCPSGGEFDTSDVGPNGSSWVGNCTNSGVVAQVTITANGAAKTFADMQQVLNTGGVDLSGCPTGSNESEPWTLIGGGKPILPGFLGGGGNPFAPQMRVCNAGDPVNCATGNLWETLNELNIPGRGVPLGFSLTYNSLAASPSGPVGFGWNSNLTVSLTVNQSAGTATVTADNGSTVVFNANGAGGWSAPSAAPVTLTQNADGTYTLLDLHTQQQEVFSATGQVLKQVDRNGYATSFSYQNGQLTAVTDPAGRSLTITHGSNGDITGVADPAGRSVALAYDSSGNLTSVMDVNSGRTSFTYDSNHLLLTKTDPRGGVLTNTYDSSGRTLTQIDAMQRKTTWSYLAGTTTITDPKGNVTREHFSSQVPVAVERGVGTAADSTWTYTYDPNVLAVTGATDPNGHTTTHTYDAAANLLSSSDALGRTTTYTYDTLNNLTSVSDPAGVTTTYSYDSHGNLTGSSRPLAGMNSTQATTLTYGDPGHPGDVTSITDPNGKTWPFTYDSSGDLASSSDPLSDTTTYTYDSIGRRTAMVSPDGNVAGGTPASFTTSYSYNAFGDLLSTTDPLGHVSSATYDANRNVATTTDADGNVTTNTYDLDNERTSVTRAEGTTVQAAYDADGNVVSQTDGAGSATTYAYDALNREVSTTDPLTRATSFGYDLAGNQTTRTDPGGLVTTSSYDAANELSGISYSDGTTHNVTFTYTADGQRSSMRDGTGTSTYTYDSLNRLTSMTNGAGQAVGYGYDLRGQVTQLTYPNDKTVSQSYDAAGRVTAIGDWLGHTTSFGYDASSNPTAETYPNGVTSTSTFNAADQLMAITDNAGATPLANFGYARDAAGQLSADASFLPGAAAVSDSFQRPNQAGWGTASDGNVWSGAGSGSLAVAANQGQISNSSSSSTFETLGSTSIGNANGLVRFSIASTSDSAGIILHHEDGSDMDLARYDGNGHLAFMVQQGGTWYTLAQAAVTVHASTRYWLRFEIQGTNVYLKLWQDGTSEPAAWTLTGSSDANQSPATAGLYGYANVTGPVNFDSFSVLSLAVTAYRYTPLQQLCYAAATNTSVCASPPGGATSYGYSAADNMTRNAGATQAFDAASQLCWTVSGTSSNACGTPPTGITSFTYDARGNRTGTTPPAGGASSYRYDQANRLTSYQAGATAASYAYDGDGQRMSKTVNGSATQFTWDQGGNLLQQQTGSAVTDFIYGPDGVPVEQINPQAAISRVGSTVTASDATGTSGPLTLSLPSGVQSGDQIIVATTFPAQVNDSAAVPAGYTQIGSPVNSGGTSATADVTQVFRKTAAAGDSSVTVSYSGTFPKSALAIVYRGIDGLSPIDLTATGANGNGTTVSASATTAYPGDELTVIQGATYTATGTGTWSAPSGSTEEGQQATPTTAIGVADQVQLNPGATGSQTSTLTVSGVSVGPQLTTLLVALKTPPGAEWYLHDHLGSTRALTDVAGHVALSVSYDAFGNTVGGAPTMNEQVTTPLLFAGQYRDAESALYYLRARYYDPTTALFLSRDPAVATTREPYAYVGGNPLNTTDPSGLYDYTITHNLGNFGAGADVTAMDILTDNPNGAFPFDVQGDNGNNHIVMGGHYCLHTNVFLPIGCDNVRVIQENATSFTFIGLAGHIEGEGSTITFSTHLDSKCNLILTQHAHGPDFGWWGGFGVVNDKRIEEARRLWGTQATRLQAEMRADHGKDPYSW